MWVGLGPKLGPSWHKALTLSQRQAALFVLGFNEYTKSSCINSLSFCLCFSVLVGLGFGPGFLWGGQGPLSQTYYHHYLLRLLADVQLASLANVRPLQSFPLVLSSKRNMSNLWLHPLLSYLLNILLVMDIRILSLQSSLFIFVKFQQCYR